AQEKIGRFGRGRVDLVADLLQNRGGAHRREYARRHNVLRLDPGKLGRTQGVEQILPVFPEVWVARLSQLELVPEALESLARFHRLPVRVAQSLRDDQRVAGVLFEQFVGLDVQRVRGDVPSSLIYADDLASGLVRRSRVPELDQENGGAVDRAHI